MKKILSVLIITLILSLPINAYAAAISSTSITGDTSKKVGEFITLTFEVDFSGLEKGYDKTLGVWFAGFELDYDENVFLINSVSSDNFKSTAYKSDGKTYILGQVIDNNTSSNSCAYNSLYCGSYKVNVTFFIKDTILALSFIKMSDIEAALLDIKDPSKEYTLDDAIELESSSNKSHTITIERSSDTVVETPKDITSDQTPTPTAKKTTETTTTVSSKSSNTFLKKLEIENNTINFDKNTKDYSITVDDNVNSLNITTEVEDSKATYKIIGNNDIKGNSNKVVVEVTAQDGSKKEYTINVNFKNQVTGESSDRLSYKNTDKQDKNIKIDMKLIKVVGIAAILLIIVIVIIIIINNKKNKKIDKLLDKL